MLASDFDNTPDPHPTTLDDDGAADVSGIDVTFYTAVLDAALITDSSGNQLDGDGDVDLSDYNTLAANFDPGGQNTPYSWCAANFDGDDDIDLTDYNVMAGSFAPGGYAGTIPPDYELPCAAGEPLDESPDVFSDQNVISTTADGAISVFATDVDSDGDADVWLDVTISPVGIVDVGRYEVFELSLAHDDTPYASPFWDVLTEATFVSPGGVTFDVEGFYYDDNTWMVRFAPTIEGTWTYEVTMTAEGDSYWASGSFSCVESGLHGQLRDHPTNPKRLIFDDGTPFGGMGTNIWTYDDPFMSGSTIPGATALDRWNTYFSEYGTHGADVYRRLLGTEKHPDGYPGAEWYQGHIAIWHGEEGPERYSLERARDMDDEFAALRENNIALHLCLYDKPRSWSGNPLNVANGGPLASAAQLYDITDATVTDLHKKYIRYIVNRYGAYVSIWELFNEFNSGNGLSLSWKEEMADHIRSLDPYGSAVTTSTTGTAPGDSWQDFQSPHLYMSMSGDHLDSGNDGTAVARNIDNWIRSYAGGLDRPNLFGEFGTGKCMPNDDPDAWRVSIWAAYFEESGVAFWDDSESLRFGVDSCKRTWNGNAYISDSTRDLFLIRKQFTDRLSPTMTQVNLSTSDPGNLRSFGLEDPTLGLLAAWVHNFTDHAAVNTDKTVSIMLPSGAFLAEWVDPKDGSTLSTEAISGGTVTLSAPAFEQDVALIVRPDTPVEVRTASLPDGVYGDEYYELLEAMGGGRPYAWSITAGALPTGVVLDPESGLLSGAPAYGGAATFTIQVMATDSSSASAEFTLTSTGPVLPVPENAVWNGNGAVGTPGDGINWADVNNWTVDRINDQLPAIGPPGDNVTFATAPTVGSIDLGTDRTINSATFQDGYTLSGNTLTIITGDVTVDPGVTATVSLNIAGASGLTKKGAGTLLVDGTAPDTIVEAGTLGGGGTLASLTVQTGATVAPGTSSGILNTGNGALDAGSILAMEVGGTTPGSEHDQLVATGTVTVSSGTLDVQPIAPYVDPTMRGDVDDFVLITATSNSGMFDQVKYDGAVLTPTFGPDGSDSFRTYVGQNQNSDDGLFRNETYTATDVMVINYLALEGDANGDGMVSLLDLDKMGQTFGQMGRATWIDADFTGDGNVTLLDLDKLGQNFGQSAGGGDLIGASGGIFGAPAAVSGPQDSAGSVESEPGASRDPGATRLAITDSFFGALAMDRPSQQVPKFPRPLIKIYNGHRGWSRPRMAPQQGEWLVSASAPKDDDPSHSTAVIS